jgi:hypothetical protein
VCDGPVAVLAGGRRSRGTTPSSSLPSTRLGPGPASLRLLRRPAWLSPTRSLALPAATAVAAIVLAGCGSASPSASASKTQQTCTGISAVLSDGPDPDADPVGYAQAQILPLEQLKVTAPALRQVVQTLVSAYRSLSSSRGATAASDAKQVTAAENALNAICPGAAP